MSDTLFKSTQEMPPKGISPDQVRVSQTSDEFHHHDLTPAFGRKHPEASVVNIERPRRGHGY